MVASKSTSIRKGRKDYSMRQNMMNKHKRQEEEAEDSSDDDAGGEEVKEGSPNIVRF